MPREENSEKSQDQPTESGTPLESGVSADQLQTHLASLLGVKAQADEELKKSEQYRSESATRLDNIEKKLDVVRADSARLESILRVLVGAPRDQLDKRLDMGGIKVTYKGSDSKTKEFLLERLKVL